MIFISIVRFFFLGLQIAPRAFLAIATVVQVVVRVF